MKNVVPNSKHPLTRLNIDPMQKLLQINTQGPGLYEFTAQVADFVRQENPDEALLTLFVRHTSCSLLIQENADPSVQDDLNAFFKRLAPNGDDATMSWLTHTAEGPDDMPAHIKAALTPVSISIPVSQGAMVLGTWQGLYLFEHRFASKNRQVVLHLQ